MPVVGPAGISASSLAEAAAGGVSPGSGGGAGLYYTAAAPAAANASHQSQLPTVDVATSLPSLPMVLAPPALLPASDMIIGN